MSVFRSLDCHLEYLWVRGKGSRALMALVYPLSVHPIIPDRIPCVDLTWISFQTSWIHRYLHSLSYIHIHAWRAVCIQPISCSPAHNWMEITNDSIFVITFQLPISNLFFVILFIHQYKALLTLSNTWTYHNSQHNDLLLPYFYRYWTIVV